MIVLLRGWNSLIFDFSSVATMVTAVTGFLVGFYIGMLYERKNPRVEVADTYGMGD